ncbi:TMEM175 family protein [Rhizobium sp. C4]|uniref:TMEM175 family protein n=1 Tax=Rhizobium sp. C4 TaxID=1349800 RepID=UPI001E4B4E5D|nr:TMEM175 family protein [Rhizobium sp. C4]MCD2173138.1 TMEM175 family protein [Rhizobium sp. C4]
MTKGRLEAFSDAVIAIIITIMVLDLKMPHGYTLQDLEPLGPVFLAYVLSFVHLGIYWSNHHNMLHAVKRITGRALWANLHLLFWLSLVPATTEWMGESYFSTIPVAIHGVVMLMAAFAYYILAHRLIAIHGRDSDFAKAFGGDWKGNLSTAAYLVAVPAAFISPLLSLGIFVLVAAMWFIPDKRFEEGFSIASAPET